MGPHGNALLSLAQWQQGRHVEKRASIEISDDEVVLLWQIGRETAVLNCLLVNMGAKRCFNRIREAHVVGKPIEALLAQFEPGGLLNAA